MRDRSGGVAGPIRMPTLSIMHIGQKLVRAIQSQFIEPHGFAGWLAGWEMALRPSNRRRIAWAVSLLEAAPTDRVLEIGFGPGIAIRELSRRVTRGLVCGVDHSAVMVRQAARRNAAAMSTGRVDLRLAQPRICRCPLAYASS
jgi:SAM-dependent methyltransferase